jgi:hypothetical protein
LLWLIGAYGGNLSARVNGQAAVVLDILGGVAFIAAAVLAIQVIRQLTARQDRKNDLIVSGQLA